MAILQPRSPKWQLNGFGDVRRNGKWNVSRRPREGEGPGIGVRGWRMDQLERGMSGEAPTATEKESMGDPFWGEDREEPTAAEEEFTEVLDRLSRLNGDGGVRAEPAHVDMGRRTGSAC
jgi:hypothetical protein